MGWGNCGEDSQGRPIGYLHPARCDHPGCKAKIDRGLAYACGGMHGEDEYSCEKYFCGKHLWVVEFKDKTCVAICKDCYEFQEKEGMLSDE